MIGIERADPQYLNPGLDVRCGDAPRSTPALSAGNRARALCCCQAIFISAMAGRTNMGKVET
jgi:hypothetical protein